MLGILTVAGLSGVLISIKSFFVKRNFSEFENMLVSDREILINNWRKNKNLKNIPAPGYESIASKIRRIRNFIEIDSHKSSISIKEGVTI